MLILTSGCMDLKTGRSRKVIWLYDDEKDRGRRRERLIFARTIFFVHVINTNTAATWLNMDDETRWIKMERGGTTWNKIEQHGTTWNRM